MLISKLSRDFYCASIFLPKLCAFQDFYNSNAKGIGKEDEEVYVIKGKEIR